MTAIINQLFERSYPLHLIQRFRQVTLELLVVTVVLAAANAWLAPRDIGWFGVNPTPYLLVPLVLAVRHGLVAGVLTGLGAAVVLLLARQAASPGEALAAHLFTLASYPLLGGLAGLLAEGVPSRRARLERDNQRLEEEMSQLHAERDMMLLSRQDLQQRLGGFGADSGSLDEELEELSGTTREFAPARLLSTLERITRVRAAALYLVPEGSKAVPLTRAVSIGDPAKFPEVLYRDEHQIVEEAVTNGDFLVQKTILDEVPARTPDYLAAYPIVAAKDRTTFVLVVQDVPITELRSNTFEVMKSICDWMRFALAPSLHRDARHQALNQCEFFQAMESAVGHHKQEGIPSTLARVPFDIDESIDPTGALRELCRALPRNAVLTNSNEQGHRSLLFLFPSVSDGKVLEVIRGHLGSFAEKLELEDDSTPAFLFTNPGETAQQTWGRLVVRDQDLASQ